MAESRLKDEWAVPVLYQVKRELIRILDVGHGWIGFSSRWMQTLNSARFNVSSDISDPCLNKGYSYFIDNKRVDAHLEKFKDKVPEEVNTCNDHNTVKLATMKGSKGLAITGVGGVVCSRHECNVLHLWLT